MATFKQYDKKDGSKAWQFQAYLGVNPTTNKAVKTTRRGFKTKKEAQLELNRLLVDFEQNGLQKETVTTFKEVCELWLITYKKTVKETTYITTERYMTKYVLPSFGDIRVDKLNLKTCQVEVNKWADKTKMYKIILQYASKVMEYAISLELADRNPFNSVIRPTPKKVIEQDKIKFYTLDELKQLFEFLENRVKQNANGQLMQKYFSELDLTLFRFLTYSGLRGAEASALEWQDIDFIDKTVTVNKNMSLTKNGFVVSTPKTKSSYRTITLDDKTLRLLKKWQLRQKEMLFANGLRDNNVVFTNLFGERFTRQDLYQRASRLSKAADLHVIGVHGFRHTHASLLFESGASMKEAQVRLGHSSIEMTMNIYTHVTKEVTEKTVEKLMKFANL
ncbi:site-specific integrase [Vagococcus hydrophili]|uniref:Site-specific integrase n=1 Tax=Vagococcus hydrophili TaxID=2714947 RepID=A0A6G8ARK8_9ENTE|nr:site-specific integrase [Vagococcus hydrophili]QIL47563.1 site-specific integrase [Vagococcus hydrophili]